MHADSQSAGETQHSLLQSDAKVIFGVLAVVAGEFMMSDGGSLGSSIRARLNRDDAIASPDSLGEAAVVFERLCQQMHYVLGAYGDDRPEGGPLPTLSVHSLALPNRNRTEACLTEVARLDPAHARIVDSRDSDPEYLVELDVAFPGLCPDAEYLARRDQLDAIARQHGGRWASVGAAWW